MRPGFLMNDYGNSSLANTVLGGQRSLADIPGSISLADFAHLLCGQFGVPVFFTAKSGLPQSSFPECILRIVFLSSKKQVARVTARWIITVVESAEAFWDGSEGKGPNYAVCEIVMTASATKTDATVTFSSARRPRPTVVGTTNPHFAPKPKDVLLTQRRDDTMFGSHDSLLHRDSWSERLAAGPQAVRYTDQCIRAAA